VAQAAAGLPNTADRGSRQARVVQKVVALAREWVRLAHHSIATGFDLALGVGSTAAHRVAFRSGRGRLGHRRGRLGHRRGRLGHRCRRGRASPSFAHAPLVAHALRAPGVDRVPLAARRSSVAQAAAGLPNTADRGSRQARVVQKVVALAREWVRLAHHSIATGFDLALGVGSTAAHRVAFRSGRGRLGHRSGRLGHRRGSRTANLRRRLPTVPLAEVVPPVVAFPVLQACA